MKHTFLPIVAILLIALALPARSAEDNEMLRDYQEYLNVISQTSAMVSNPDAQRLAQAHGLNILNVTWEDTGRYKGSSVGPNISDMTIQVQMMDPRTEKFNLHCMPVIRFPNFSDKTGDIRMDSFHLMVGNEKGGPLKKITLKELLSNPREYLTMPDSWKGEEMSLLARRDKHALVSAQACFLPIPSEGEAQFNPVLFNYQSRRGDPAVLTILATREGTSVTVIDNKRDAFQAGWSWGQRLFFNQNGERASLTGTRQSDFINDKIENDATVNLSSPDAAGEKGLNMVLLIQVPLKQKEPMYSYNGEIESECLEACDEVARRSDVENAVIGHGPVEGPFTEIADLEIKRDPRFPVRVTVQFYKATSNGVVSDADMSEIAQQIQRVYDDADYVGSLVTDGETDRPTEYDGEKTQPRDWWQRFWQRHNKNMEDPNKS